VVRAPIAPHETRSAVNCGEIGSRNSQPALVQIEEEPARPAQALVDGEASVEVRIIDQTLPADRGPRLLEVHAHDDAEVGGQLPRQLAQAPAVVEASFRVMDRAGSDDDK
jgi:hypothetical protein